MDATWFDVLIYSFQGNRKILLDQVRMGCGGSYSAQPDNQDYAHDGNREEQGQEPEIGPMDCPNPGNFGIFHQDAKERE